MTCFQTRKWSGAGAGISAPARLTNNPKAKNQLKKGNMSEEKKDKPQVEVRDLKPNTDAKGGRGGHGGGGTGTPPHRHR
jgi:hypothetical protein